MLYTDYCPFSLVSGFSYMMKLKWGNCQLSSFTVCIKFILNIIFLHFCSTPREQRYHWGQKNQKILFNNSNGQSCLNSDFKYSAALSHLCEVSWPLTGLNNWSISFDQCFFLAGYFHLFKAKNSFLTPNLSHLHWDYDL